jgi:hypothetical protein
MWAGLLMKYLAIKIIIMKDMFSYFIIRLEIQVKFYMSAGKKIILIRAKNTLQSSIFLTASKILSHASFIYWASVARKLDVTRFFTVRFSS